MAVCVYGYMHSQLYVLYLRRYAFTAVCIHGCMHSSLYALMAVCTYGCMHSRLYAFTGEHIHGYMYSRVYGGMGMCSPLSVGEVIKSHMLATSGVCYGSQILEPRNGIIS